MVGEFPELQGLMGRYYALHDGEPAAVAAAIEQHYWPRFAGDALPDGPVAQAVALADKLETLAGMFGIGAQPTGDKDPFGLRRHAIGVIRILVEQKLAAGRCPELVAAAFDAFAACRRCRMPASISRTSSSSACAAYLREAGYSANQVEAVLCQRPARLDLVPAQCAAVRAFGDLPEAATLAAANKRIVNILRSPAARRPSPSIAPGSPTAPSTISISRSRSSSRSSTSAARRAILPARCWRWPDPSRPSTGSSTTCWSWPTIRPSARTGSRCCAAWRRR